MSEQDHTDSYRLDASQAFAEIERLEKRYIQFTNQLQKTVLQLNELGDAFDRQSIRIKEVDDAGNKYSATIKKIGDEFKITSSNAQLATNAFSKQIQTLEQINAIKMDEILFLQEAMELEEDQLKLSKGLSDAKELERRRVLELQNTQKQYANQLAQDEKDFINFLKQETAEQKKLADQRAKDDRDFKRLLQEELALDQQKLALELKISRASETRRVRTVQAGQTETFNKLVTQPQQIERENARLLASFKDVGDSAEDAGHRAFFSWRDLGRLFLVQNLHLLIREIVSQLSDAVKATEEFEIKISQIRTVSQSAQLSFNQWSLGIQALSDKFGDPILDVAAAGYETITNKVVKGADAFKFLNIAMQFGLLTQATAKESIDLFNTAINGFRLNVADTEKTSRILFNTVSLGGIKVEELREILGKTAPLANQLGVNFTDLSAAVATLKLNGTPAAEIGFLLNNIFERLLIPSKEMTEVLHRMGVASGAAAFANFGLSVTLQKLDEATKGSDTELAKLFTSLRSQRGVIDLTSDSLEGFKNNLAAIKDEKAFDFGKIAINESDARNFQIEINRIKNFVITDFGEPFLAILGNIGREVDADGKRLSGFSDILRDSIPYLTGLSAAIAGYVLIIKGAAAYEALWNIAIVYSTLKIGYATTSISTLKYAIYALQFSLGPAALAIAGITALVGYIAYDMTKSALAASDFSRAYTDMAQNVQEASDKQTQKIVENIEKQTEALKSGLDEGLKSTFGFINRVAVESDAIATEAIEKHKSYAKEIADSYNLYLKSVESNLAAINKQITAGESAVNRAKQEADRLRGGVDTSQFNRKISLLPGPDQINAIKAKIDELTAYSNQKLTANFGSPEEAAANQINAQKAATEAERLRGELIQRSATNEKNHEATLKRVAELQAKSSANSQIFNQRQEDKNQLDAIENQIAQSSGHKQTQLKNELRILRQQTEEREAQSHQNERTRQEDQELETLKKQLLVEEAKTKALGDQSKLTQDLEVSQTALADALEKQAKAIQAQVDALSKQKADEQKSFESLKILFTELNELNQKIPKDITNDEGKSKFLNQFDDIQSKITAAGLNNPALVGQAQFAIQALAKERGDAEKTIDAEIAANKAKLDATAFAKHKSDLAAEIDAAGKALEQNPKDISKSILSIQATASNLKNLLGNSKFFGPGHENEVGVPDPTGLNSNSSKAEILQARKEFLNFLETYKAQVQENGGNQNFGNTSFEKVKSDIIDDFDKLLKAQGNTPELQKHQAELQKALSGLIAPVSSTTNIPQTTDDIDKFGKTFVDAVKSNVEAINQLTAAATAADSRIRAFAAQNNLPLPAQSKYFGGVVKGFSTGGIAGDNIPAWLTAGERVMNLKASGQYADVLDQMNKGYIPTISAYDNVRFNFSNQKSSVNIGDVHIHVDQVVGDPSIDLPKLGQALQRGVRLGMIEIPQPRS